MILCMLIACSCPLNAGFRMGPPWCLNKYLTHTFASPILVNIGLGMACWILVEYLEHGFFHTPLELGDEVQYAGLLLLRLSFEYSTGLPMMGACFQMVVIC